METNLRLVVVYLKIIKVNYWANRGVAFQVLGDIIASSVVRFLGVGKGFPWGLWFGRRNIGGFGGRVNWVGFDGWVSG